jgi:gluconate 5-dehydrogenase
MAKKLSDFFDLNGKTAVVTGGYGHLGTAMVRALIAFNVKVIVAGRSVNKFNFIFSEKERKEVFFRCIDITSTASINQCFTDIINEYGRVDILVNNAHTGRGQSQDNMSDADWTYTMEGVLGSVHKTIRTVMPIMRKQGSGKIINITSMYGMVSPDFRLYKGAECEVYINPPHYGAAKAGMIQLTKYYAVLLGDYNIQVNAISPGPFPNIKIQQENPLFIERLKMKNPLHRIGRPEDLAGTIILLSSKASDFITGQTIQIDGGWTIW